MKTPKIEVNAPKDGVLTILTGEAEVIKYKQNLILQGNLESLIDFVAKREKLIDKDTTHVIFNEEKQIVKLVTSEQDDVQIIVAGSLEMHSDLAEMGINVRDKYRSIAGMIQLFKLRRRFFHTNDQHAEFLDKLKKFEVKTEIEFKNQDDFKGSIVQSKITNIKTQIPLSFSLHMKVFKGGPKREFGVEVEIVPDAGSIKLLLMSTELQEIIEDYVEEQFDNVREVTKDYVNINQ